MRRRRLTIVLMILLTGHSTLRLRAAEWQTEASVRNNDFGDGWILTPAGGIAVSWKWLRLGADASIASYTPAEFPNDYRSRTRVSLVPMLRLPLGRFFVQAGCGIAASSVRRQIWTGGESYRFDSEEGFRGELRGEAGVRLPVFESCGLILKGGAAGEGSKGRFFYAGLGFGIRTSQPRAVAAAERPMDGEPDGSAAAASGVRSLSVVGGTDDVSRRFSVAIESALIRSGIEVVDWNRLKATVDERLRAEAKAVNPRQSLNHLFTDSLSAAELAFHAADLHPIDAIIETGVRYTVRAYGEEPVIESSRIRLIIPSTGAVVWSAGFDSPDPSFEHHLDTVIRALMKALPRVRKAESR
jgi:hypothetical protein